MQGNQTRGWARGTGPCFFSVFFNKKKQQHAENATESAEIDALQILKLQNVRLLLKP